MHVALKTRRLAMVILQHLQLMWMMLLIKDITGRLGGVLTTMKGHIRGVLLALLEWEIGSR